MIDNQNEYILCAAIWYKDMELKNPEALSNRGARPYNTETGVVICGWRHFNCILTTASMTGERDCERGPHVQGFLTSFNRFVDRQEAAEIAFNSKQISNKMDRLTSENLY